MSRIDYNIIDNSQKSSDANLFLGIYTEPYPIQLKETNRDFISPENLEILKSMNFITDKEQVSFIDLMEYLPLEIPGMCEPLPQKCSFDLRMDIDYLHNRLYRFFYGDFIEEYEDYMILFTNDKFKPAFVISENPLEGILNLVYWYLKFIVNNYNEQSWIRNFYFSEKPEGKPGWEEFKNSFGQIEPDERDSNRHFNTSFVIKKPEMLKRWGK